MTADRRTARERGSDERPRRVRAVVIVAAVLVLAVVVALHLTGAVGPGAH